MSPRRRRRAGALWPALRAGPGLPALVLLFALLAPAVQQPALGQTLPPRTEVLNAPQTLWQSHRTAVLLTLVSGLLLGGLLVALLVQRRQRSAAEAAVRRSEAFNRVLFEQAPDALLVLDVDRMRFVAANPAAEVLFGRPLAALLQAEPEDLHSAGDLNPRAVRQLIERTAQRALEGERRVLEVQVRDAQGGTHRCELRAVSVPLGNHLVRASYLDIGPRLAQQQALRDEAIHRQAILDHVLDAIVTIDARGTIQSFNQTATRLFGYSAAEAIGQNVKLLMPEPFQSAHDGHLQRYALTGERTIIGSRRELQARHRSGRQFPINLGVTEISYAGQPVFVGLIRDLSERKQVEAELHRLAFFDSVTGLPNRRLLLDRLGQRLLALQRSLGYAALLYVDVDGLKAVNDLRGHALGDTLLDQLACRLVETLRPEDTVARVVGDEFAVLLDDVGPDRATAARRAERVAQKVAALARQRFELGGQVQRVSLSIGVTLLAANTADAEHGLAQGETAMVQAKAGGPGNRCFFDAGLQEQVGARAALAHDLRLALDQQAFSVAYQPQVNAAGELVGVEALLRWQHPVRGWVSPAVFIPAAEESGAIHELGRWVLEQACAMQRRWQDDPRLRGIDVAVNVTALEFHDAGFLNGVIDTLERSGAVPERIKLELTESALSADLNTLALRMNTLRGLGLRLSLDDFGTGYSSLSYLRRLPLDQLKIDRSFVSEVHANGHDAAIVRAVMAMSQALGLSVIAEGVECEAQRDFLLACHCREFQGYLFGRPMPEAELLARFAPALDLAPVLSV